MNERTSYQDEWTNIVPGLMYARIVPGWMIKHRTRMNERTLYQDEWTYIVPGWMNKHRTRMNERIFYQDEWTNIVPVWMKAHIVPGWMNAHTVPGWMNVHFPCCVDRIHYFHICIRHYPRVISKPCHYHIMPIEFSNETLQSRQYNLFSKTNFNKPWIVPPVAFTLGKVCVCGGGGGSIRSSVVECWTVDQLVGWSILHQGHESLKMHLISLSCTRPSIVLHLKHQSFHI